MFFQKVHIIASLLHGLWNCVFSCTGCICGFSPLVCLNKVGRDVICFDKWLDHVVVRAYLRRTNDKLIDRFDIFASGKIL